MNGVSVGAVNGARAAYDIHNTSSNQENHGLHKVGNGSVRQRPAGNLRSPLSSLPAGRIEPNEYGQAPQQRSYDRMEDMGPHRGKTKNGFDSESQQHLYKHTGSNGNLSTAESDDIPENMYRPEKEDLDGWIHREKLAKIENEELQAAGINLAKAKSRSRDDLGDKLRSASRDRLRNDLSTTDGSIREGKRRKVSSPVPVQPEEDGDAAERANWDFRTPEEVAADLASAQAYKSPVLRKSGSKIPVLSPSATPALLEQSERDSPVNRKRTMSGGSILNQEELNSSKLRTSNSNWNEDAKASSSAVTGKPGSPVKARQKSISGGPGLSPASEGLVPRKQSTSKPPPTSPNGRPRTRGTDTERPRTAVNPPEGDPPWLADMYKPDPRLPPDQQVIPTLARKQQQMQWQENGMVPKTYDRRFEALAVYEQGEPSLAEPAEPEVAAEKPNESESWPLKPIPSVRSGKETGSKPNLPTPPAPTGGYSTMPKVSSPPMSMTSPKLGSPVNANVGAPSPNIGPIRQISETQQQSKPRIQQRPLSNEEDEKIQKKGCACCVVM